MSTCFNRILAHRLCYFSNEPYTRVSRSHTAAEIRIADASFKSQDSTPGFDDCSAGTTLSGSSACAQAIGDPDAVNMLHMDSLIDSSFNVYVPDFDDSLGRPATELFLKIAQEAVTDAWHSGHVYMHLCIARPVQSSRYLDQVSRLQTRVVKLFNVTHKEDSPENCVTWLPLFSVPGPHILTNVLRDDGLDFASFLNCFVHGVKIHGGVKFVAA